MKPLEEAAIVTDRIGELPIDIDEAFEWCDLGMLKYLGPPHIVAGKAIHRFVPVKPE